jgi:hypothetical protein
MKLYLPGPADKLSRSSVMNIIHSYSYMYKLSIFDPRSVQLFGKN